MVQVTLLGTGATMPVPGRALTAMTLSCGGRTILFDCGEGTQLALRRYHVSPARIDLIALTHYHGDHIFGLPGLLQTIGCLGRTEPLYFAGPDGLRRALEAVLALAGTMPFEIRLIQPRKGGLDLTAVHPGFPAGSTLSAVPTEHRVPSQGYVFRLPRAGRFDPEKARALGVPVADWSRLQKGERVGKVKPSQVLGPERRGIRVVLSGDTRPCRALEKAARGADLLVHEATYAEDSEEAARWGHTTFPQAAALAAKAKVERLWLTHFSQTIADPEECLPAARTIFPNTDAPADGTTIELKYQD